MLSRARVAIWGNTGATGMQHTSARTLATVRDYGGLVEALRARCDELNVAGITLDDLAGLAVGHVNKLLCPQPMRVLGPVSLPALLGALGLQLIVAEDPEALARVRARLTPRTPGTATRANNHGPRRKAPRRNAQALRRSLRPRSGWQKTRARGAVPSASSPLSNIGPPPSPERRALKSWLVRSSICAGMPRAAVG